MNIIIIGAGMIGKERIKAVETINKTCAYNEKLNIIAIVDPCVNVPGYNCYPNLKDAAEEIQSTGWAFVCTPHHVTKDIVTSPLLKGINVLVEKPLGRTIKEANEIFVKNCAGNINVGFNYRFYKGVNFLLQDVFNHLFGDIISVNMILGLSNAPGTEKTWRMDPVLAGSGSLVYAGIHLIDLAMLISDGSLQLKSAINLYGFYKTGIEEETHILAFDKNDTIYNIQSSVIKWRSTFRIEVNGTDGYGIVEGRNRYYGNQKYIRGKRWGWLGGKSQRDSEEIIVDYDGEDSFAAETKAVLFGTSSVIKPATQLDNKRCLKFINSIH